MKGSFSEEALIRFAEFAVQNQPADFAEGDTYDFTRCVRADGSAYGTGGKCRKGSEAGAREKPAAGGGKKKTESEAPIAPVPPKPIKDPIPGVLAKAKELKDLRRQEDQRVTDLAKAGKIKGVDPGAVDRILAKKSSGKDVGETATPKPLRGQHLANMMKDHLNIENSVRANHGGGLQTKAAKEEFAAALKKAGVPDKATIKAALIAQRDEGKAAEVATIPKPPKASSKVSDKKLKAAFDKSIAAMEAAEREKKELNKEGVDWKDPRSTAVSEKMGKAQESITTIRQAYHAVDRERFLKESAQVRRLELKARAIRKDAEKAAEKEGLSVYSMPDNHPLKKRWAEAFKLDEQRTNVVEARRKAAFYGEPASITKAKSDGGGQVDPSVPSRVPRGGAGQDLKDFLNGSEVVMAFNPSGFSKFISQGEAKNGFQQGTGGIKKGQSGYLEGRKSGEEKVMGISKQTEASQRPVYAALEHPDRTKSLQGGQYNQMANYGGIQVVMNPSVKDRATFTVGDSLDYNAPRGVMASPVRDPADPTRVNSMGSKKVDFNPGGGTSSDRMTVFSSRYDNVPTRPSYVETQIHGGLKSSDIKEVRYYKGHDIPAGTRKLLEKQGVKIVELPPQMGDLNLYSDNSSYKDITAISPAK